MRLIGTPVAYDLLGCDGLCIAISSLNFVEFPRHIHTLRIPSPSTGEGFGREFIAERLS
jgi:hypothetical protein